MYYAGIGSRKTPHDIRSLMSRIGEKLARAGITLRSGGAKGADMAFESGCKFLGGHHEIFYTNRFIVNENVMQYDPDILQEAATIAQSFHPAWNKLSPYAQKLIARNTFQILGADLKSPSDFVLCWTLDGSTGLTTRKTGGTGQALRIASHYRISIFNLALKEYKEQMEEWLTQTNAKIGSPLDNSLE